MMRKLVPAFALACINHHRPGPRDTSAGVHLAGVARHQPDHARIYLRCCSAPPRSAPDGASRLLGDDGRIAVG
jgi:hypothetical protein